MDSPNPYLTEPEHFPLPHKDRSLRAYVDQMDSKINYAKWKQNLVLTYNYLPLSTISDKLEESCTKHRVKMEAELHKVKSKVENPGLLEMLKNLHNFNQKLSSNVDKLETQILEQTDHIKKLQVEMHRKKIELKNIMRNNMENIRESLIRKGINTSRDLVSLKNSRSTRAHQISGTTLSSKFSIHEAFVPQKTNKQLFQDCLKSIMNEEFSEKIKQKQNNKNVKSVTEYYRKHSSVPEILGEKWNFENFKKLSFHEIIELLKEKDPKGSKLQKMLEAK